MFFLLMCVAALRGFLKMLLERLAFSLLGMGTPNHWGQWCQNHNRCFSFYTQQIREMGVAPNEAYTVRTQAIVILFWIFDQWVNDVKPIPYGFLRADRVHQINWFAWFFPIRLAINWGNTVFSEASYIAGWFSCIFTISHDIPILPG